MLTDSITEEIRSIRRALASRFDNDISRILADVRQREKADGRSYVRLAKPSARGDGDEQGPPPRAPASAESGI